MNKTKTVFSFKKKNTLHDTGNKLYIGDPKIENFLTYLSPPVNY